MATDGAPEARAAQAVAPAWRGRIAVVSPHLDDGVLSLGASMRAAVRSGAAVDLVTVLAGDPDSNRSSGASARAAGFATTGEAARLRRAEDARACRALGVHPVWLPFVDDDDEPLPPDDALEAALATALSGYDAVLLPGFPLGHPHHLLTSRLALAALPAGQTVGFYVEQPYAAWRLLSRGVRRPLSPRDARPLRRLGLSVDGGRWQRTPGAGRQLPAKHRALGAYASQLRVLRAWPRLRVAAYEAVYPERVLWCALAPGRRAAASA